MNHRYFSRTPIVLKIKLTSGQKELGHFITRDLNHDGMGIEGDFSQLTMKPVVRVELVDPGLDAQCEMQGLLVYHADNSIGVMFDSRYQETINNILSHSSSEQTVAAA